MSEKLYDMDELSEDPIFDLQIANDFMEAFNSSSLGKIFRVDKDTPNILGNNFIRSIMIGWNLHRNYLENMNTVQESLDNISMNLYTCNTCEDKDSCEYAFNEYNLDGDCLASVRIKCSDCYTCVEKSTCLCATKEHCDGHCMATSY